MTKFKDRKNEEICEIYNMVQDEIERMLDIIEKKTGYYTTGHFVLCSDEPKECMDIDIKIALLEQPHEPYANKLAYYKKVNPDNVINKNILAHQHNSWYMIYDGVHRTNARRDLGFDTVKADIIVPEPKK
jgi:hypothetical protein